MTATNRLAGAILALVVIVTLVMTMSGPRRELVSRERQPTVNASETGPAFSPRGLRTRVAAISKPIAPRLGRVR